MYIVNVYWNERINSASSGIHLRGPSVGLSAPKFVGLFQTSSDSTSRPDHERAMIASTWLSASCLDGAGRATDDDVVLDLPARDNGARGSTLREVAASVLLLAETDVGPACEVLCAVFARAIGSLVDFSTVLGGGGGGLASKEHVQKVRHRQKMLHAPRSAVTLAPRSRLACTAAALTLIVRPPTPSAVAEIRRAGVRFRAARAFSGLVARRWRSATTALGGDGIVGLSVDEIPLLGVTAEAGRVGVGLGDSLGMRLGGGVFRAFGDADGRAASEERAWGERPDFGEEMDDELDREIVSLMEAVSWDCGLEDSRTGRIFDFTSRKAGVGDPFDKLGDNLEGGGGTANSSESTDASRARCMRVVSCLGSREGAGRSGEETGGGRGDTASRKAEPMSASEGVGDNVCAGSGALLGSSRDLKRERSAFPVVEARIALGDSVWRTLPPTAVECRFSLAISAESCILSRS